MPHASLRQAALFGANLREAVLLRTDLSAAFLWNADLSGAKLSGADLSGVQNLEEVRSLEDTDLRGVKGLTKKQLEYCKAKGAIIDEDPTTSSTQSIVVAPSPP